MSWGLSVWIPTAVLLILQSYSEVLIMDGLDAYFDRMLDTYLEDYFTDAEDERDGIYDEDNNDDD